LIKGLGRGGAERLVVDQVTLGDRDAFEYEVAYLLPWKDALVADLAGIAPVHCLGARSDLDPRWALRLRRLVHKREIDLVHIHSPYVAGVARLVLRATRARVRLAYTLHNRSEAHRPLSRWIDERTLPLDDLDFAVSEDARDSLSTRDRQRFEVVHHGVDPSKLVTSPSARDDVREELGIGADEPIVLNVANLRAAKDHATLLRAAVLFLERVPRCHLLIAGLGPLEDQLRKLHGSLGLDDRVQLLGRRDDVPRLLAASDVFVLSSTVEGLPVALMEALALGVPVVATEVGGIPELVRDGVEGRLVPPARPAPLAVAITGLLTDPALRSKLGEAAAARGRALDLPHAIARIEGRYHELGRRGA
jgi:glycosyltransferase involved in cell wall biosynthesis